MESARTLRPGDGHYPDALARIAGRPAELRLRGSLGDRRRVALVGSRATDEYGADLAREIAAGLAHAGVSVVSGGALGIDGIAHAAAVEAGGHTIAVLGSGVDVPHPASHRALFASILEAGGALLSEFPDGTPAFPSNFPARNRIVSGLSEVVVVVRAGERSGALITAPGRGRRACRCSPCPGTFGTRSRRDRRRSSGAEPARSRRRRTCSRR